MAHLTRAWPLAAAAVLAGCSSTATGDAADTGERAQDAFWQALSSHCGQAYAGGLVSEDEVDYEISDAAMTMHVRECSDSEIRVPFHIEEPDGTWNRSRSWVFTRTPDGLRLKHDHRHEDGTSDAVTMYGGDTAPTSSGEGSAGAQEFPVDAASIALFRREGLDASVTNIWRVEVAPAGTPGARYAYQLVRTVEGGAPAPRDFRVEFDLTRPIAAPPPPWGFE